MVLDYGASAGSTALLAARKIGSAGKVMLFDLSDGMLNVAKERAVAAGVRERLERGETPITFSGREIDESWISSFS